MPMFCEPNENATRPVEFHSDAAGRGPGRFTRMAGQAGFLGLLMLALAFSPPAQGAQLVWDANPEPTVVGYRVYRGGASRNYTNAVSVAATSVVFADLAAGATYFFAVTALDATGLESGFSAEVSYVEPALVMQLQSAPLPGGLLELTGTGRVGHIYEIQATTDFAVWTVIGTQMVEANGFFAFIDFNALNYPARFYRTRDLGATVPAVVAKLQISRAASGVFSLTGSGQAGHTYGIQATTDFTAWITIGTQTAGASGSFTFSDNDAPNYPARFYRARDAQP